jgi:hypothetical protein
MAAPAAEAPAEEPAAEDKFKITTGMGFRSALRFQGSDDPESLDDVALDELNFEARFSGKVTDIVGWTGNLTVDGRTTTTGGAGPIAFEAKAMDLVGQLDFADPFHVWIGRMLTPSDRSNFSGAWFMSPWNYPGVYFAGPVGYVGPRGTEEIGRETGVVVWGNDAEGKFKYYAGVMDLDTAAGASLGPNDDMGAPTVPEAGPLYALRAQYAFIGSEPGFYSSSTYYGSQDILSLGAAFRYQKDFYGEDEALTEFNADLLAEFNVGGTLTGELAYYNFANELAPVQNDLMVVASYTTADAIGVGKLQPVVSYQMATGEGGLAMNQFSVYVNYVMKDYFAKLMLGFTHSNGESDALGESKANLMQLGFQIQQ